MGTTTAYPPLHTAEHLLTAVLQRRFPAMSDYASRFKSRKCVFEFNHPTPLTAEDMEAVEADIRAIIAADVPVRESFVPRAVAQDLPNLHQVPANADPVRVVHIGAHDTRACIGIHVTRTGEIQQFRITSFRPVGPTRYRVNFVVS